MTFDAKDAAELIEADACVARGRNASMEIIAFWANLQGAGMDEGLVNHLTIKHHRALAFFLFDIDADLDDEDDDD